LGGEQTQLIKEELVDELEKYRNMTDGILESRRKKR
jgi:hypothetical protein